MSCINEIEKMNARANEAIIKGEYNYAYKLRLMAAEKAVLAWEQSRDVFWIELARKLFKEALKMKKKLIKAIISESWSKETSYDLQSFEITPRVSLRDIGGLSRSKKSLQEALEWPLKYEEIMKEYGLEYIMKGCLLFGPPGCGKTLLVEGMALDLGVKLLKADPSLLMSKWVGDSEKIARRLFQEAQEKAPSIVFVDEVDKILPSSTSSSVVPRLISIFLQEMDGVKSHESNQAIIVMASNEPWKIKPAILRPGRCDRIIYIPPPDWDVRKKIFQIHSRSKRAEDKLNFDLLANITAPIEGWHYSGSDIANICRTAKREAMRYEVKSGSHQIVKINHFLEAIKIVPPSISPELLERYQNWSKKHTSFIDIQT